MDIELRDAEDKLIASVNKNLVGLARELFTDANQYVIRLGPALKQQGEEVSTMNMPAEQQQKVQTIHTPASTTSIIPTYNELDIVKSLNIDQKAIVIAAAIAVDFDYFSHTSGRPGVMSIFPFPLPTPASAPVEAGTAGIDATDATVTSEEADMGISNGAVDSTSEAQSDKEGWNWSNDGDDDDGDGNDDDDGDEDDGKSVIGALFGSD